jgi:hypothetical protein
MLIYKLIFQYFRLVLCNNNSEQFLKTRNFSSLTFFVMMEFCNLYNKNYFLKNSQFKIQAEEYFA